METSDKQKEEWKLVKEEWKQLISRKKNGDE